MNDQFISSTAERGQGLVEYALILVLVAVVVIIGLSVVGTSVQGVYCDVVAGLQSDSAQCGFQEGDQCQVTEFKVKEKEKQKEKISFSLFTMKDGRWVFERQSKTSFDVAECPAGTTKHQ
jgi:pilus assembly protein Flp/PilA